VSRQVFPPDEHGVEVIELTEAEGRALFDKRAREALGISGEEFLRRLDAGEYPACGCCPHGVFELRMLEPFARSVNP
jgi:hypothetical protein